MSLEEAIIANTNAQLELATVIRDFLQKTNGDIKGKPQTTAAKAQTEAAKKPESASTSAQQNSKPASNTSDDSSKPSEPVASDAATAHTYDEVKALVLEVSKKSRATPQESREQAEALLARFGVQKISQLGAAVYGEVHALATKIMAGEVDATASETASEGLE